MSAVDHQVVLQKIQALSTPDRPIYVVGGAVRDLLRNQPVHDLDFSVAGPTQSLARQAADMLGGSMYVMDQERDTSRVVLQEDGQPRFLLDFACLRAGDLDGDLRSRDFTINAMAYDVANPNHLIDPTGGLADLRAKQIRACHAGSLKEDPVRVLRAVRQALQFQYRIESETIGQMRGAAPLLGRVSPERRRDELFKMLGGRQVARAIELLDRFDALRHVLPEMEDMKGVAQSAPHVAPVWEHTLAVVEHLEQLMAALVGAYHPDSAAELFTGMAVLRLGRYREQFDQHFARELAPERSLRALLFLAALYHDISKPATRSEERGGKVRFLGHPEQGGDVIAARARALALSNDEVQRLKRIVNEHMRCHFLTTTLVNEGRPPSRRAIFRFFRDVRDAGIDICLLSLADVRGTYGVTLPQDQWLAELDVCRALLEAYWEQSTSVVSPPQLLSGHDLMNEFQVKPGRILGRVIEAVRESQAAGEISTRDEAFEFVRSWLAQSPADSDGEGER